MKVFGKKKAAATVLPGTEKLEAAYSAAATVAETAAAIKALKAAYAAAGCAV